MTITFLFPNSGSQPCGGLKVICEYANRLAKDGHDVHIAYAGSIFWGQKTPFYKCTGIIRYLQTYLKGYSCKRWFALDKRVKEHWCWSLNERHVPKSDNYICTSPYTAMYLKDYRAEVNKFYFIQGYENWGNVTEKMLFETYHYPLRKFAVASWLQDVVRHTGEDCGFIPNGFDKDYFRLITPIREKNKYNIVMLYHTSRLKGCQESFEALKLVHDKYPQIHVQLFGSPDCPNNLPTWYTYHKTPNKELHNKLYDDAAIYIGSSHTEGWCLTIGEAMLCGCAVACTDIPGYREMAKDYNENQNENVDDDRNENLGTALLSPVGDAEAMAKNIIQLIEDDELRCRIAKNGHEFIQQFTWDKSYKLLKDTLFNEN